jgi:uroporphyrin-3 C-methyltransferase
VDTAVVALESADSRLAALRDPGVTAVRQQLAKEIQALRSVQRPDTTGIMVRLTNAEEQAATLPVRGIVAVERTSPVQTLPEGLFSRAWVVARNAISGLISIRKVDDRAGSVVTLEEQALRRQHLQLLLFSARTAVVRHDNASYRSALAGARQWLSEFFDVNDAATTSLLNEIQSLEPINIDPQLPDVSGSARILQRTIPARRGAQ